MTELLAPYWIPIPADGHRETRRVARCPVCGTLDTLRVARGMILCTHCFWALEIKQAS